jgi:hypothetical protein
MLVKVPIVSKQYPPQNNYNNDNSNKKFFWNIG